VLTSDIVIHILGYKVQDGTLSADLLRPVHPIFTSTLINNLAFKALTFAALVPVWIVLVLLFQPDFSAVTPASLLLSVPAIVMGFGISFLLGATVTSIAFWTTRVYSFSDLMYMVTLLFSGQFVPLQLMPPVIQQLALLLPFQYTRYFPVQVILNGLPPGGVARGYVLAFVWLVLLFGLFVVVWRAGLKRFSAVGA
jgi:ABC-2 type transport system permease protein